MAAPAKCIPQDLPPDGGYDPIQWKRIKLKTVFGSKLTLALYVASTVIGALGFNAAYRKYKREELEMRSARFAMLPYLVAERDRMFLRQLKINEEEERELMKNDPEWDVGTYYREPIYITTDKYHEPHYFEFMAHANGQDANYKTFRRHFT